VSTSWRCSYEPQQIARAVERGATAEKAAASLHGKGSYFRSDLGSLLESRPLAME
jgi:hypothetical protein